MGAPIRFVLSLAALIVLIIIIMLITPIILVLMLFHVQSLWRSNADACGHCNSGRISGPTSAKHQTAAPGLDLKLSVTFLLS